MSGRRTLTPRQQADQLLHNGVISLLAAINLSTEPTREKAAQSLKPLYQFFHSRGPDACAGPVDEAFPRFIAQAIGHNS